MKQSYWPAWTIAFGGLLAAGASLTQRFSDNFRQSMNTTLLRSGGQGICRGVPHGPHQQPYLAGSWLLGRPCLSASLTVHLPYLQTQHCCAGLVRVFAEVYPVEACHAVRRCTLITNGAVTETLSVSAVVSPCRKPTVHKWLPLTVSRAAVHWQ